MDNEYETIIHETLDSFYENADSKEEFEKIASACRSALERAEANLAERSGNGENNE